MDKYECTICGYIYDEAEGDADNGMIGLARPAALVKTLSRKCKIFQQERSEAVTRLWPLFLLHERTLLLIRPAVL